MPANEPIASNGSRKHSSPPASESKSADGTCCWTAAEISCDGDAESALISVSV